MLLRPPLAYLFISKWPLKYYQFSFWNHAWFPSPIPVVTQPISKNRDEVVELNFIIQEYSCSFNSSFLNQLFVELIYCHFQFLVFCILSQFLRFNFRHSFPSELGFFIIFHNFCYLSLHEETNLLMNSIHLCFFLFLYRILSNVVQFF